MAQFRIVLDDVELSEEQQQSLDVALQKATLAFLADIDGGGDEVAYYTPRIFRPPLAGIWIRKLADISQIKEINESIDLEGRMKELNRELQ